MANILDWNEVSRTEFTSCYKEKNIKYFVFKLQGVPDFSDLRFSYLAEKTAEKVIEEAKKQMLMLRQFHDLGSDWSISLRLFKKDLEINVYIIFRYSGLDILSSEESEEKRNLFMSMLPKEYTFSYVEHEDLKGSEVLDASFANECAEVLKHEQEYCGEVPYVVEDDQKIYLDDYREKFYSVSTWQATDNNVETLCDALMHYDKRAVVDICITPTSYLEDERDWISINLKRMKEVMNGQKLYRPQTRDVLWSGEPVPIMRVPSDNYDKMNKQYEVSRLFLSSIRVFSEDNAAMISHSLLSNSVKNEGQVRIFKKGVKIFDTMLNDYEYLNVSIQPTPYWIANRDTAPYRAQRFNRLCSLEEISNYFRIPIPKQTGFPGLRLDTGLRDFSTRKAIKNEIRLGNYLDDSSGVDLPASFDVQQFAKHGLIVGVPGSGKTTAMFNILYQLWDHHIPFIVLEPAKTEYRALKTLKEMTDIKVFTLGDEGVSPFRFNPMEVLPGIKLERHISSLQSCFIGAFDLFDPLPIFLEQAIKRTYQLKGWYDGSVGGEPGLETPTLSDLCESAEYIVSHSGFDAKMKSDFQASLLERLNSLRRGSKGKMLDTKKSIPMEDLMNGPVVLELDSLNGSEKSLMMMFLLTYVYEYCKVERRSGSKLKHMLLVEEAHNLIASTGNGSENRADPKAHTIEIFVNMLAEMRALGEGILIADQLPTAIAAQAVKQTNVKVLMRMTAKDDREVIGNTMDLDEIQMKQVVHFKSGHAYIYHEGEDHVRLVRMLNFKEFHQVEEPPLDSELKVMMQDYEMNHPELYKPYELCNKCCKTCNRRVRDQVEAFTRKTFENNVDLYELKFANDSKLRESLRARLGICQLYKTFVIPEYARLKEKFGEVGDEFGYCAFIHFQEFAKKQIAQCHKCDDCALKLTEYLESYHDYESYDKYLQSLKKKGD